MQDILAQAATKKITGMELCERIVDGENVEGIKTGLKKNLVDFVQIVRELRVHAKKVSIPWNARSWGGDD